MPYVPNYHENFSDIEKAVLKGEKDTIANLLSQKITASDIQKALHLASSEFQLEIFTMLLKHGADINKSESPSDRLGTILIKQCRNKNLYDFQPSILDFLLKQKGLVDPNITNADNRTALWYAAERLDEDLCKQLIALGAKPENYKEQGWIPLILGILSNDLSAIKKFCLSFNPSKIRWYGFTSPYSDIYYTLMYQAKVWIVEELIQIPVFREKLIQAAVLNKASEELAKKSAVLFSDLSSNAEIKILVDELRFLVSQGFDFLKTSSKHSADVPLEMLAGSPAYHLFMLDWNKTGLSASYMEFLTHLREAFFRIFLGHRFALDVNTNIKGGNVNVEGMMYLNAIQEFKISYRKFIENKKNHEEIKTIINAGIKIIKKYNVSFDEKEVQEIIRSVSEYFAVFATITWKEQIPARIKAKDLLIIPVRTYSQQWGSGNFGHESHAQGVALFENRILKLNRGAGTDTPGIRVHKVYNYNANDLEIALKEMIDSQDCALESGSWSDVLDAVTNEQLHNIISKKDQTVGNCCWATSKMFLYAAAYGTIYQYCIKKHIPEDLADQISEAIANKWYKCFTIYDRNLSITEYLSLHQCPPSNNELTVRNRISALGAFLKNKAINLTTIDIKMIAAIYLKSINWYLYEALKAKDYKSIEEVLENEKNNPFFMPIIDAIQRMHMPLIAYLAFKPSQANCSDENGNGPLHVTAQMESFKALKAMSLLLDNKNINKINIKYQNKEGHTALHLAALNNNVEAIELLLKQDSDLVNIKDAQGKTALELAVDKVNKNAVKSLIVHNAAVECIPIPIESLILIDISKLLIEAKYKMKSYFRELDMNLNGTILHRAVLACREELFEVILLKDPSIVNIKNRNGKTALQLICESNTSYRVNHVLTLDTVKTLLKFEASVENVDFSNPYICDEIKKLLQEALKAERQPSLLLSKRMIQDKAKLKDLSVIPQGLIYKRNSCLEL